MVGMLHFPLNVSKNVSGTILLSMLGNHILDILILVSQSVNSEKLGVEL